MDQNFYVEYYTLERSHWWFKVRSSILKNRLASLLPGQRPLKVLNVGVATGATSEMLQHFGEVMSVEYDQNCYEFTKSRLSSPLIQGSILDLPFENASYDLVCAFDVIEHVEDDAKAVSELKRVCKPGGTICLTVPAFMSLWSQHDEVNHHFRRYTLPQLSSFFKDSGTVTYQSYFNSLLFPPVFAFRKLTRLLPKNAFRKGAGADNTIVAQDSFVNKILYHVFDLERRMLNRGVTFPAGVSVILCWKKEQ